MQKNIYLCLMKKTILALAAIIAFTVAASAQRYNNYGLELTNSDKVETNLRIAFPMYFGMSTLLNNNDSYLETILPQNFVYSLEMASMRISSRKSHIEGSLGVRWTFMDFSLRNKDITFREGLTGVYVPSPILLENLKYDGTKSKIHATYLGIPLRIAYKAGKGKVYAGASAEFLVKGYTKYRNPGYRETTNELFNRFRATAEAGFSYGLIGVFVSYGFTPLFPSDWSNARTISFSLTLGI